MSIAIRWREQTELLQRIININTKVNFGWDKVHSRIHIRNYSEFGRRKTIAENLFLKPKSYIRKMPFSVEALYPQFEKLFVTQASTKNSNTRHANAPSIGGVPVYNYPEVPLAPKINDYIQEYVKLCKPDKVYICDGSSAENKQLLDYLINKGTIKQLPKYENCCLARTNPADVARVESKTFICSDHERDVIPIPKNGVKSTLGNWISPMNMNKAVTERFPSCMAGRTMYVIPFSMGPVNSEMSKFGIQLTDSPYVVCSMRIMTRMGENVLKALGDGDFVKCVHSTGFPKSDSSLHNVNDTWPCDPERTIILHKPSTNEIISYGSGYGGNSLLGKKCFALRIGSTIARKEGWLAEHMLILGITNPQGRKRYIAAAFPSACGKTNLAMMKPTLPGYKVECVGDDIAWMRFDSSGKLRAINPENGFFGVAPGTSYGTNPNAMNTIFKNTVFTNVATTSDGGVFWEGMEKEVPDNVEITDWLGKPWKQGSGNPAAHPNSRFTTPACQCPIIDPSWEDPNGVPIDAILFGGRRPQGVPLVYQARDWQHGVFLGATMRSESTAAAEHKGKIILHDPFAMRPFFGYNFGQYLSHWLNIAKRDNVQLPYIFHVNWFRKDQNGRFLWPGFGENSRVLDWIFRRIDGEDIVEDSPIGYIPKQNTINLEGLKEDINLQELFHIPKDFWLKETSQLKEYLESQVGDDLPTEIRNELDKLRSNIEKL